MLYFLNITLVLKTEIIKVRYLLRRKAGATYQKHPPDDFITGTKTVICCQAYTDFVTVSHTRSLIPLLSNIKLYQI